MKRYSSTIASTNSAIALLAELPTLVNAIYTIMVSQNFTMNVDSMMANDVM